MSVRFSCATLIQYLFNSSGKYRCLVCADGYHRKAAQKALEMRNKELADYKYALDETSIVGITTKME
jgi:hypothetical protein